ncbi:nitrate reductase cytochrome c-type subunit [Pseudoxanthomonas daejeonensis]|uniref:nitrate reductase cytochrome c-type subunit n=1 Tax=Pseudoxanthomonas daejeonensis TaxID=266062 RepID=UPI001F54543E|nr:nitrate reductase cytochrome c-type subunit [Pseudoxanthomonas daejeonensis]UNK58319.1 nitrate reductase cytochrome c-type subunit [Pseudoxanthomonas daejeonensis]
MRNKPLLIVAGLVLLLSVLVFAAGWMFGSLKRPDDAQPAATASTPVGARAIFVPGDGQIDALRRGVPVDKEGHPPPMARVENTDMRRVRNYPMQPPTIPHAIDGYQVDKNSNRCMLCHARANAATFQAPPVSVTHYMDRDDQFLATISPRRYFCSQCHVVQTDAPTLVANGFRDIDSLMAAPPPGGH